jgi:hypothetical protein
MSNTPTAATLSKDQKEALTRILRVAFEIEHDSRHIVPIGVLQLPPMTVENGKALLPDLSVEGLIAVEAALERARISYADLSRSGHRTIEIDCGQDHFFGSKLARLVHNAEYFLRKDQKKMGENLFNRDLAVLGIEPSLACRMRGLLQSRVGEHHK